MDPQNYMFTSLLKINTENQQKLTPMNLNNITQKGRHGLDIHFKTLNAFPLHCFITSARRLDIRHEGFLVTADGIVFVPFLALNVSIKFQLCISAAYNQCKLP